MTDSIAARQEEFDAMTRAMRIVFTDGSSAPYQSLVKGFIVKDGESIVDALLRAAQEVAGDRISLVSDPAGEPDGEAVSGPIADLQRRCHDASYAAGWWHHPDTGLPYIPGDSARADNLAGGIVTIAWENIPVDMRDMITHYWPFVLATKMALIHSEVSEGLEALRRGARDDKLAHRLGLETELSDAVIREFDIAGAVARAQRLGIVEQHEGVGPFDLDGAITEKMAFNKSRPDHKVAARRAAGGKAF